MRSLIVATALAMTAPAVAAQDFWGLYFTEIGIDDMYNSDGDPLYDICQMVQQDRANFHRFGITDPMDEGDPFFGTVEARQIIPGICMVREGYEYIRREVENGNPRYVYVEVFGSGKRMTHVVINEGGG